MFHAVVARYRYLAAPSSNWASSGCRRRCVRIAPLVHKPERQSRRAAAWPQRPVPPCRRLPRRWKASFCSSQLLTDGALPFLNGGPDYRVKYSRIEKVPKKMGPQRPRGAHVPIYDTECQRNDKDSASHPKPLPYPNPAQHQSEDDQRGKGRKISRRTIQDFARYNGTQNGRKRDEPDQKHQR